MFNENIKRAVDHAYQTPNILSLDDRDAAI